MKRFRHQAEHALVVNKQGEQTALRHCEHVERLRRSAYHHALRICQEERNQGSQYYRTEMSAKHQMNTFQSQELTAQR
eukprot:12932186-Prorocentrum_lima.AAC.1